jgi:hypothetical protein
MDFSFGPSIENYVAIKGGVLVVCSAAAVWLCIPRFGISGIVNAGVIVLTLSVLAYLTQTWTNNEFLWTIVLSILLVGSNRRLRPTAASVPGTTLIPISLLLAALVVFAAVRNVDFYFLHLNLLGVANPNAVAGLLGAALLVAMISYRVTVSRGTRIAAHGHNISFPLKCLFGSTFLLAVLALVGTMSRLVLLWIALLLIVCTVGVPRFRLVTRLSTGFVLVFSMFSMLFTLIGVSNQGETVMSWLERITFDWRMKGDVDSDLTRIKYSQILYNYMLQEELLVGQGFGVRGYRAFLGEGEDLHNAYLTTLSDCGFIGVAVLLALSFVWPLIALVHARKGGGNHTRALLILGVYSTAAFFPGPLYGSHFLALALTLIVGMGDLLEGSSSPGEASNRFRSHKAHQAPRRASTRPTVNVPAELN